MYVLGWTQGEGFEMNTKIKSKHGNFEKLNKKNM